MSVSKTDGGRRNLRGAHASIRGDGEIASAARLTRGGPLPNGRLECSRTGLTTRDDRQVVVDGLEGFQSHSILDNNHQESRLRMATSTGVYLTPKPSESSTLRLVFWGRDATH